MNAVITEHCFFWNAIAQELHQLESLKSRGILKNAGGNDRERAGGLGVNRIILGVLGLVHKGCGLKG